MVDDSGEAHVEAVAVTPGISFSDDTEFVLSEGFTPILGLVAF